jgi:hypothetical protein
MKDAYFAEDIDTDARTGTFRDLSTQSNEQGLDVLPPDRAAHWPRENRLKRISVLSLRSQ